MSLALLRLYRAPAAPRPGSSTRQPAGVGPGLEKRPSPPRPPAPTLRVPCQSPPAAAGTALSQGSPEPSPLEIVVYLLQRDIMAPPSKAGEQAASTLIPVVIDDLDEIIELD